MLLKSVISFCNLIFPTVQITDTVHTIYIGKKLGLPILFTLPQNSFNILINVITEHLLYELNFYLCICTVTDKKYFVKGELPWSSFNVIYLVECSNCKHQYLGSARNFKQRFRIDKSNIKLTKIVAGLLGMLITYAVTPVIPIFIQKFSSQSKCSVMTLIRTLKLFCGSVKSIGNPNFLPMYMV